MSHAPPAVIGLCLAVLGSGCSIDLPQIPDQHPANAGAPAGRVYATPAVLEVRPIVRPPDSPSTRPFDDGDHGDHGGQASDGGSRSQQQMQKEGQLHDHE